MGIYMWREFVMPDYLCFTANTANSTVSLNKKWSPTSVTLETSTDWITWNTYTIGSTITLSNIWDKVYWRNISETDTWFGRTASSYYYFSMTWSIAWSWDTTFLINKNWTNTLGDYYFARLFQNCTSLTSAPSLPATTLWEFCYGYMFYNTSIVNAPSLSATTLSSNWYCYQRMFGSCSLLEELPQIHATSLGVYCCNQMFSWCSKIKLSTTQTWEYQTPYRIPITWTWTAASWALLDMFTSTWWTWTWTPSFETTYYTSNTVV